MLNLKLITTILLSIIIFSCSKSIKTSSNIGSDSIENLVIKSTFEVDSAAQFVGGNKALMQYILQNIRYPIEAHKAGVVGKVFVNFVVLKTGDISYITTSSDANKILAKEAIRLIKNMPKWNPATIKGEPVNSKFVLPITFMIEGARNR